MSSTLTQGSIVLARKEDSNHFDILFQTYDLKSTTFISKDVHWTHIEDYLLINNVFMEVEDEY